MPLSQQSPSVLVPKHERGVVAFPYTAIAATPAARCGLGGRLSEVVACGLQAFLKLRNAPAHGCALGCVGVDDGVLFVRGHAPLSISADLTTHVHGLTLDHRVRNQALIAEHDHRKQPFGQGVGLGSAPSQ